MKLSVNDKTGKMLIAVIAIAVLLLTGLTAIVAIGVLDIALLGGLIIFLATIGTLFVACGLLMMLRKTERSIAVGTVIIVIGALLLILALLGQFGVIPGM